LRPALFLDVDGTLVEIAPRPEDVRAGEALRGQLERLSRRLDGAVALVSGRSLADLDRLFEPLVLPAAGQHGVELRPRAGTAVRAAFDEPALGRAGEVLRGFAARHPGLRLEDKGGALALHFRAAPLLESEVDDAMNALAKSLGPAFHVQRGLLVRELKPCVVNKGSAVRALMAGAPFAGRVPIAIGDDLTDLDAFQAAEELGGFGVAVGDRVSAPWQLPGPRALRAWLAMLAELPRSCSTS
jgi:trehalose 6-phosphate phosphatase